MLEQVAKMGVRITMTRNDFTPNPHLPPSRGKECLWKFVTQ
jgi:hypothetical protein